MIAMSKVLSSFQEMPSRLHFLPFLAPSRGHGMPLERMFSWPRSARYWARHRNLDLMGQSSCWVSIGRVQRQD